MRKGLFLAVAALAAAGLGAGVGVQTANAGETVSTAVVRHAKGFTMDVGDKHAVGHYQAVKGRCDVTLMIAEKADHEDAIKGAGSRLTMTVVPGRKAMLETAAGKSLELGCTPAAAALTVKVVDRARG